MAQVVNEQIQECPKSPVQVRPTEEDLDIDYYDVMIVGLTGQGKSTTSDKLIIANHKKESPPKEQPPEDYSEDEDQIQVDDKISKKNLTFWAVSDIPDDKKEPIVLYLKGLDFFRELDNPHLRVNESRKNQDNPITSSCQLISNDTTGIRVLDVPGFFSVQPSTGNKGPNADQERSPYSSAFNTARSHLAVMRNILRIQSTMKINFKRILYFLPVRGPLERPSMVLEQELVLMAHYFDRSIFDCMVLVVTFSEYLSQISHIPEDVLFPEDKIEQTKLQFQKALRTVLPQYQEALPNPPVIFISMSEQETCESILKKVQEAPVEREPLRLIFNPGTCIKCSHKIESLKGERIKCIQPGEENGIDYDESHCHPIFLPKYTRLQKIVSGILHLITFAWRRWPDYSVEMCPNCNKGPGSPGCMKINDTYEIDAEGGCKIKIKVDHTNELDEHHRVLYQNTSLSSDDEVAHQGDNASPSGDESDISQDQPVPAFDGGNESSVLVPGSTRDVPRNQRGDQSPPVIEFHGEGMT